jgi:uncharacterized protein (TIGR02453 family)
MSIFPGFRPPALTFLRGLKRNNRREWFQEHRAEHEEHILQPLRLLVEEMDVRFARFAPEVVGDSKRSIFRIYRDVRFSNDKSPYKTHAACWFSHRSAGHGVGSETHGAGAGFYFHLEPGASIVAGGIWMPPRPSLNRLREVIAERPADFARTLRGRVFRKRFRGLSEERMLTRLPRGFDPGHAAEPWLRYVSFTVSAPLSDRDALDPRLPQKIERDFGLMLPLVRWLNAALGYPALARRAS